MSNAFGLGKAKPLKVRRFDSGVCNAFSDRFFVFQVCLDLVKEPRLECVRFELLG